MTVLLMKLDTLHFVQSLHASFNVPANGLQIPIADEAPYAKFYTELTHIDPVQPVVNAAILTLHKMAHLNYCSSELLEDTIYAAGYVVETFVKFICQDNRQHMAGRKCRHWR